MERIYGSSLEKKLMWQLENSAAKQGQSVEDVLENMRARYMTASNWQRRLFRKGMYVYSLWLSGKWLAARAFFAMTHPFWYNFRRTFKIVSGQEMARIEI